MRYFCTELYGPWMNKKWHHLIKESHTCTVWSGSHGASHEGFFYTKKRFAHPPICNIPYFQQIIQAPIPQNQFWIAIEVVFTFSTFWMKTTFRHPGDSPWRLRMINLSIHPTPKNYVEYTQGCLQITLVVSRLLETNSLYLRMDGWNTIVFFWALPIFRCFFEFQGG